MAQIWLPFGKFASLALAVAVLAGGCAAFRSPGDVAEEGRPQPGPSSADRLDASFRQAAVSAEASRDYAAAVTFYNTLYDRNPDDLPTIVALSRNLRYVGANSRAADVLRAALATYPNEAPLMGELGKVQLAAGQPEEALVTLMKARELRPEDWRIHSALGITFDRIGQYASARLSYERALGLSPNNVTVLNNLALSHVQAGELDQGIKYLGRAAALPSSGLQVRQNLALLYALKGDIDEAEKLARRDLPEKMVAENLEYYRRLAAARDSLDIDSMLAPTVESVKQGGAPVAVQLDPWEEDTDAEREGLTPASD